MTVDLRPTTLALNLGILRKYLLPRFGRWPLLRITTADVTTMVAEESAGDLSSSAVRRDAIVLGTIRALLSTTDGSRATRFEE
jgi:hypothetical protein